MPNYAALHSSNTDQPSDTKDYHLEVLWKKTSDCKLLSFDCFVSCDRRCNINYERSPLSVDLHLAGAPFSDTTHHSICWRNTISDLLIAYTKYRKVETSKQISGWKRKVIVKDRRVLKHLLERKQKQLWTLYSLRPVLVETR